MLQAILDEKIAAEEFKIEQAYARIEALKTQKQQAKYIGGIKAWLNYEFESSSGLTQEFALFAREYKKAIKGLVGPLFDLVEFNRGHFYISGFLKNRENGKIVYFSISDIRNFKNEWYSNILIRTAKNINDYNGGTSMFTSFDDFVASVQELTKQG